MNLNEAIQVGLESVRNNSSHALSPYYRNLIYGCIGPLSLSRSRCIRVHLAIAAAQKVLPLWKEARPDDSRVEDIIRMTTTLVAQQVPGEIAKAKADEFWAWLVNDHGDRTEELSSKVFFCDGNRAGSSLSIPRNGSFSGC